MSIEAFLSQYGLMALFVGAGVEGETVVILGGMAAHRDVFGFVPAILAAAGGSFVADQGFFAIGRRFRDARWVTRLRGKPAFTRALAAFERQPTLFVFGFRFLYGLRTVSPVAIGTSNLPTSRFVVLNLLAALLWGTVFIYAGYWFGQAIEAMFGHVRHDARWIVVALAVAIVASGVIAWSWRRLRG